MLDLFLQQGCDERQQVSCDLLVALRRGVDAVGLYASWRAVDFDEKKGQQRGVELLRQQRVSFIEFANVVGAVVGWEGDASENDLAS